MKLLHNYRSFRSAWERSELGDLALSALLVPLVWLALGWRPGLVFSIGDGLDYLLPLLHFLREQKINSVYYDPGWLGGAKVAGVWATPWFLSLALRAGCGPATALFACFAFGQAALAFASLKLLAALGEEAPRGPNLKKAALVALFAFAPVLGGRVASGHFFYPSLLAVAALALYAGLARRRIGATGTVALWLTLAACWQTVSYQQLVSAAYVCLPPLLVLFRRLGVPRRAWVTFSALGAAAVLWSLREQAEMWRHFTGGDASRSEHGRAVVYSFLVLGWRDWLSSLFWQPGLVPTLRPALDAYETELAFGPLLALLGSGWWLSRKRRPLLAGLSATALLSMLVVGAFASRAEPFATLVLWLAYPLQYFRVPMRTLHPLVFAALPLALAAIEDGGGRPGPRARAGPLLGAAAALALVFSGGAWRELFAWGLLAAFLVPAARRRVGEEALLLPLALAAVLGFQARLAPVQDLRRTDDNVAKLRAEILRVQPELANPLVRATLAFQDDKFLSNTAHVLGISALDGYWQPLRSYNQLTSAAYGLPIIPFSLNFRVRRGRPGTFELFHLFNVRYELVLAENGEVVARPTGAGGEAVRLVRPGGGEAPCAKGRLLGAEVTDPYFALTARLDGVAAPCRLVVAASFAENLRAYDERGSRLPTVPVAGGLLGVEVRPGTLAVSVRAEAMAPAWTGLGPIFAGGLLLFCALSSRPRRRAEWAEG